MAKLFNTIPIRSEIIKRFLAEILIINHFFDENKREESRGRYLPIYIFVARIDNRNGKRSNSRDVDVNDYEGNSREI